MLTRVQTLSFGLNSHVLSTTLRHQISSNFHWIRRDSLSCLASNSHALSDSSAFSNSIVWPQTLSGYVELLSMLVLACPGLKGLHHGNFADFEPDCPKRSVRQLKAGFH